MDRAIPSSANAKRRYGSNLKTHFFDIIKLPRAIPAMNAANINEKE